LCVSLRTSAYMLPRKLVITGHKRRLFPKITRI
jgi:hypothetical protein